MDNLIVFLKLESLQYLDSESPYETVRYALEVIVFYELVQVHAQAFESDEQMLPKHHVILNSYNIMLIMLVVVIQVLEDS